MASVYDRRCKARCELHGVRCEVWSQTGDAPLEVPHIPIEPFYTSEDGPGKHTHLHQQGEPTGPIIHRWREVSQFIHTIRVGRPKKSKEDA